MGIHCGVFRVIEICLLLNACSFSLLVESSSFYQQYDKSSCYSQAQLQGSNYLCNSRRTSCNAFVVYRVQNKSQTLSSIAALMDADLSEVYQLNKLNMSDGLVAGEDIIVPVTCTCLDRYSRVELVYNYSSVSATLSDVACVVFEGLVKAQVLMDENQGVEPGRNVLVKVPLRCACPNLESVSDRAGQRRYLVTYPVVQTDSLALIAAKFNVTVKDIADANGFGMSTTIFPQTTLLIPTSGPPKVDRTIRNQSPGSPASSFPLDNIVKDVDSDAKKHYVLLGGGLVGAIFCSCLVFLAFVKFRNRYDVKVARFEPLACPRLSNLSPDIITGMSELKHSLMNFTSDEIRDATGNFSSANTIGSSVFLGRTSGTKYAMQKVESDEAVRHVVYILTRINHLNVVKLIGCCYERPPYLVFEYAENGSLKDCLSNKKTAKQLTWTRRKQIAFDLAVGLHYLHYSTKPSYIHCNINSRNVLITTDYRAKISGFGLAKPVMNIDDNVQKHLNVDQSLTVNRHGYLAPECVLTGATSSKTDVYAFGVVLLELLSAEEAVDQGRCLKDSVRFLANGSVKETLNSSSEKLKEFMDPVLEGEFELGAAVCVALLAKCCVADDPQLRPNMNDVLKTLSRVV
ncbi:unnamed protein product [Rhodiola kirilowii]